MLVTNRSVDNEMLMTPSVPAAFFGIVLGLVGLGSCRREASRIWNAPAVVGESVMAIAATVWGLLVLLYVAKWIGGARKR